MGSLRRLDPLSGVEWHRPRKLEVLADPSENFERVLEIILATRNSFNQGRKSVFKIGGIFGKYVPKKYIFDFGRSVSIFFGRTII